LIPVGLLATVPLPVPELLIAFTTVTLSVNVWGAAVKVAVQVRLPFIVSDPVPQQLPLQPAKVKPAAAEAVRTTTVPLV
jgi:hypothetical protein